MIVVESMVIPSLYFFNICVRFGFFPRALFITSHRDPATSIRK